MAEIQGLAAIYCRISRDHEGEKIAIARQEELCRELAAKHNLEVVKVYPENDIGASKQTGAKKRPYYQQMLLDARAGMFTHIVSYSNSRLTRRVNEFEALVDLHDDFGINFLTVDTGKKLDLSTPQGLFIARMLANVASLESAQISQRQKDAFAFNAAAGKPKRQRQRAFGWKKDGITQKPEEVVLIREGIGRILNGEALSTIGADWTRRGILTASGRTEWEHGTLKRVLTGWRTAGVRTVNREPLYKDGELVMGTWEPIISFTERDAALAMLAKRTRVKKNKGNWLLTGLMFCGVCGGKMYGQLTGTPTYACKPGNGHCAITSGKLEDYVLLRTLSRLVRASRKQEQEERPEVVFPKAQRLQVVLDKIEEVRVLYNGDKISLEDWLSLSQPLTAERDQLRREEQAFHIEQARPKAEMRSTSELMEWMQDVMGESRWSPRVPKSQERWGEEDTEEAKAQPWGADLFTEEEDEDGEDWASFDLEDDDELEPGSLEVAAPDDQLSDQNREAAMLLRREVRAVVVKRGQRGRAGWGEDAFKKRVGIAWHR